MLLLAALTAAGRADTSTCSLEDLFAYVGEKPDDIKIAKVDYALGQEQVKLYQGEAMPYVSFSSGASYAAQSMEAQKYQFGSGAAQVDIPHFKGVAMNWGLNLHQPLITFGKVTNALKIARTRDRMLDDNLRLQRDIFYLTLIREYQNAYLAQKSHDIAEESRIHAERLRDQMKLEYDMGRLDKGEWLRIQARALAAAAEVQRADAGRRFALRRLANLAEMPCDTTLTLVYRDSGWVSQVPRQERQATAGLEFRMKRFEHDLRELNTGYERSKLFPSVNLAGSISNQIMHMTNEDAIEDAFLEAAASQAAQQTPSGGSGSAPAGAQSGGYDAGAFSQDPEDFFDPDFFNYTIGLQLTWDIFAGRRKQAQFNSAKYSLRKAKLELKKLEEDKRVELAQTRETITTLEENIAAVAFQVDAARQAFDQMQTDYNNGFATTTDLVATERELYQAQQQLASLKMQRVLAIAQLKLLTGLPLNEAP